MMHAFVRVAGDLSNLRGYVADRFGESDPDVVAWLKSKRAVWVESVPGVAEQEDLFWASFWGIDALIVEEEAESDEIAQVVYELALEEGEPWAVEAHEHRSGA